MEKLFGTDGVRGLANEYPMTGEVAMAVGRAIGHVLCGLSSQSNPTFNKTQKRVKVVVGKDTRLSGYMIETALTSGLCSAGADVILIGPLSTPGVAFVTQSMRADAGVMISASHNPYYDNGIKIFSSDGYKLPDHVENVIEDLLKSEDLEKFRVTHGQIGRARRIDDVLGRYVVFLKALFPKERDLTGFRIALDCANGAAYKAAPLVFEELGAEVIKKGVSPNGININDKCGALYPENIARVVTEFRADIGISLDGDGDRCILTDELGDIVDGDQIIGLCALALKEQGLLAKNTVVTTPMSNIGLELFLKKNGIQMIRAKVGDRYVVETMRKEHYTLGGEQSGHIVFADHSTTGDGIIAALKVLEIMCRTGRRLSELKKGIELFPQVRVDVKVSKKTPFEKMAEVDAQIKNAESQLKDHGRVFVRYSGTESLARVMIEGEDHSVISVLANNIAQSIQKEVGE